MRRARPGSSDGLSTANFSDSGLAMAAGSTPGAQNGSAACRSMKANVTDSEKPAARSTRRTARSVAIRLSGAACGVESAGNVAGKRSNP